ncbi:hypothetical protein IFM89_036275, partial [Coptis chinensis]
MDMQQSDFDRLLFFEHARKQAEMNHAKNPLDPDNLRRWGGALLKLSQFQNPLESQKMIEVHDRDERDGFYYAECFLKVCVSGSVLVKSLAAKEPSALGLDTYYKQYYLCLAAVAATIKCTGLFICGMVLNWQSWISCKVEPKDGVSEGQFSQVLLNELDAIRKASASLQEGYLPPVTYARCTRSVSVVPPVYYAHLAAFRARYYIEGDVSDSGTGASATRGQRAQIHSLPKIKDNVKD